MQKSFLIITLVSFGLNAMVDYSSQTVIEARKKEGKIGYKRCLQIAELYALPENIDLKNITNEVLQHKTTSNISKELIRSQNRTIILFEYPSDGYQVKAIVSYTPDIESAPLLFSLRGGNRIFGLMNPGSTYHLIKNYTVIAPAYRGGVSQGKDEFGGNEVNDIKNLVNYLPELQKKIGKKINPPRRYIWGSSRGAMQMFLALQRHTYLQKYFDKCVSLTGLHDISTVIKYRPGMKTMFVRDFGLTDEHDSVWINHRSPVTQCDKLEPDLPILIIQGTNDNRTHIEEGNNMVEKLNELGKKVTYWKIEGGTHCLANMRKECDDMITKWLES